MSSHENPQELEQGQLALSELFGDLSKEFVSELERFFRQMFREESFSEGATIFDEGDPAKRVYLLLEGSVKLSVAPTSLPEPLDTSVLTSSGQGRALGWSGALGPGRYSATARALSEVRVLTAEADAVLAFLDDNPVLGYAVMKRIAQEISRRLASMRSLALATVCD